MNPIAVLQIASLVLMAVTTLLYAYQVVYLFLPLFVRKKGAEDTSRTPTHKYAVLIPARNEEAVLPHLLDSLRAQDYPQELLTLFVIADNCTDSTAKVAREHGAVVFERENKVQVGKGYALDYLLSRIDETISLDTFDAFLIFDADNLLQKDYISKIDEVHEAGYAAFCGYRNSKNYASSVLSAGYSIWYLHDSCHLNYSRMAVGNSCNVNGTGFGFTRELIRKIGGWKFYALTEDIEFSTYCATHGIKIGYCHDAILYDEQPLTLRQSWKQRIRWVQGGIQVSLRHAKAIFRGLFQGSWKTFSTLETLSLSLWGYILGISCGILSMVTAFCSGGLTTLLIAAASGLLGALASILFIGALTVFTQWDRIRATNRQKLIGILALPVFLITFVPIAVCAFFQKAQWTPVEHTVAISAEELEP